MRYDEVPRTNGESLISRVAKVLEAFDRNSESMSLSTLANRTGLPLPSVHRLVTEMVRLGLLERATVKEIRIGLHLWELSTQGNRGTGIREAALPFMVDLRAAIHQIVTIAVLDNGSALFLERLAPPETALAAARTAERHPLHASSSGLVLLAFSPAEYQEKVLSGPLQRTTNDTVTNSERLRSVLADIRRQRIGSLPGIGVKDWTGMAVPVFGPRDKIVAALSVVYRRGSEEPLAHSSALHTAAAGISRALGSRMELPTGRSVSRHRTGIA